MIIDGHQHVLSDKKYQKEYNIECGVDKVILFPTVVHPETAESRLEFISELEILQKILRGEINPVEARIKSISDLKETIKSDPDFFIGFGSCPVGFDLQKTAEWIEQHIIKNKFRGIGELSFGCGKVHAIENIFCFVHDNQVDLPIWIHTFNPLNFADITDIVNLAKKYHRTKVILGHSGGENWLQTINIIKDYENIYMDLSASFTTFSIKFIAQELPDRTLFSSDMPYGDPYLGIGQINHIIKDHEIRNNVLGLNLRKLLDI